MKIGYLMQAGVPDVRKRPMSGPALHVKHVFEELNKLGHQVRLLASLDGQIWLSDDLESYEPVTTTWLERGPLRLAERAIRRVQSTFRLPYAAFFESLRFALACRQTLPDCDLYYERMGWMGYGGSLAAQHLGIPLVLEVNGDHLSELEALGIEPSGLQRWLSIKLMAAAVRRTSFVVAAGEGWRDQFIDRWHVLPDKVTVIENGSEIVDLLSREQLRTFSPADVSSRMTTIIYVGGFEPWHGITILIKAVARAISQGINVCLVLVGSGTQYALIEKMIRDLNIDPYVTLTGYLPVQEAAGYLAKADIGVSPYCGRVEYSGLKLLDYKAAGLATIASGKDGQPAVLEHGRTGWIVPPCDEDALCQAINYLATNSNLSKRMGRQARMEAEQYHSWQHTALQLSNLFEQVMVSDLPSSRNWLSGEFDEWFS